MLLSKAKFMQNSINFSSNKKNFNFLRPNFCFFNYIILSYFSDGFFFYYFQISDIMLVSFICYKGLSKNDNFNLIGDEASFGAWITRESMNQRLIVILI